MNKYMRKLKGLGTIAMMALGLMVVNRSNVHAVYSDTISSNNAAALVVRITPNADRGVTISSSSVQLDLGFVDLGASTQTVSPATVTINGNMTETELDLSASISGGWVFSNSQTFTSTGTNQLNAWLQFTSISTASAPSQSNEYFRVGSSSGSKITSLTNSYAATAVGISGGAGTGKFENNEGGSGDMDSMVPGDRRHLWTFFTLPPTTSLTTAQDINFVLSVRAGP